MASRDVDFKSNLEEKVIPGLLADGAFGPDVVVVKHDVEPLGGFGETHWMSTTFKARIELQNRKTNVSRTEFLVAKYQAHDQVWCDSSIMCRNEEIMYHQIIPFFQTLWDESKISDEDEPLDIFPKCYLARADSQPLVVMEDLEATSGFRLAPSQCALDGAHAFLALRKLGKLHALSYAAKVRRRDDFLAMAKQLKEAQFIDSHREMSVAFFGACVERGLRRLAARGEKVVDPATVDILQRRLGDIFNLMVDARSAEEPLAVVTHGDFCINNTMFKYDQTTGKPIDVRLVDFQTSLYCSPAVDLSFFLFLNTTPSQRSLHWDDFFVAYYDGLTTAMRRLLSSGPDMSPTMEIPSLAALKADFARHALYGYGICSFFLPVMQADPKDKPSDEDYNKFQDISDNTEQGLAMGRLFCQIGGEAADDTLADLLLEFVERNLI